MRKVEFDQGSDEWLKWRKGLLTATDAPGLMGASPYVTPYKLWQRKIGEAEEQAVNQAMLRGQRDEPIARDWFNDSFGFDMQPCCIESGLYNFLGASLDGLSACGKYILEIKSNGDQYHYGLNAGLPDFHMMQIQHQMLCTDELVEKAYYLSMNKGEKVVIEVLPDKSWLEEYLPKAMDFWKKVVMFEAPEMTNKDYVDKSGELFWGDYAKQYRKACEEIKVLEQVKESYREKILKLCSGQSSMGNGIKVVKKMVKGRVDYDTIMKRLDIDTDLYRKPASESWAIMIDK